MAFADEELDGWHVEYEQDGDSPDASGVGGGVYDHDYFTGAVVRYVPQYGGGGVVVGTEVRVVCDGIADPADARLIAAAPDLRDALRAMAEAYGTCATAAQQRAADLARAALARLDPHPRDLHGGVYRSHAAPETPREEA